jgi:hypothetical protein
MIKLKDLLREVNIGDTYISSDGKYIDLVFDTFMKGKCRGPKSNPIVRHLPFINLSNTKSIYFPSELIYVSPILTSLNKSFNLIIIFYLNEQDVFSKPPIYSLYL